MKYLALALLLSMPLHAQQSRTPTQKQNEPEAKVWPKYPPPADVITAMKQATSFMRRECSFAGGYAWRWPEDLSQSHGEDRSSPSLIMIQPPGTPAVGHAMLEAYRVTGDKLFLQGAREAAQCLLWCQLASGGWAADFDFKLDSSRRIHFRRDIDAGDTERGSRGSLTTLDDDKTQSALLFLLDLAHSPAGKDDAELHRALKYGMDGLLAAQASNGGWPQRFAGPADQSLPKLKASLPEKWSRTWPGVDYTGYLTLNDGNILRVIQLLLRAHSVTKEERYLDSAKKAGQFLRDAQLPAPQPAWAQQYDKDMHPAWARKFEPPALSSLESIGAISALIELWLATGDESWLAPTKAAIAWLDSSKLPKGSWSRFYELGSNKPLYCKRDSYELTYEDTKLPTHYGFQLDDSAEKKLAENKELIAMGRDAALKKRALPGTPKEWTSKGKGQAGKTVIALSTLDKKGRWMKDGFIDAALYVKHMKAMTLYVEAAKEGGDTFTAATSKK